MISLAASMMGCRQNLREPGAPKLRNLKQGWSFSPMERNHDQVFAVVYSLHPLLAAGRDGDSLVSNSMAGFIALPVGWHRRARSAGVGGRPDLAAGPHAARNLDRKFPAQSKHPKSPHLFLYGFPITSPMWL